MLNAARLAQRKCRALDPLRTWALGIAQRSHHNKATCALANKLARICFAVLRSLEPYAPGRLVHTGGTRGGRLPPRRDDRTGSTDVAWVR